MLFRDFWCVIPIDVMASEGSGNQNRFHFLRRKSPFQNIFIFYPRNKNSIIRKFNNLFLDMFGNIIINMVAICSFRAFQSPRRCSRCDNELHPNELVIRVKDGLLLFHVGCFACVQCARVLSTGDLFGLYNRSIYCKEHYEGLARAMTNRSGPSSGDSNNNKSADKGGNN